MSFFVRKEAKNFQGLGIHKSMDKKLITRRELLDRWRGIEGEEEDQNDDRIDDPSKHRRIHRQKEQWFADAYNFLISLPEESHIWCSSWDLMGPLLETFYNYFKDERQSSPLRCLWRRISEEMQCCIQCISQHHQAQELYSMEYELSSIGPLLNVLRSLDEERVTHNLRERNFKLAEDKYDPTNDNAGVVCLVYEVLMYPVLLDDQSLFTEFEKFIEAVDNMHELTLAGEQQFPGIYALFFFKRRVRSVGHRLAGFMGRLRKAADLEPLQPLLKKFIGFLELEVFPSTLKNSRPRAELDRTSIWLGIKSLLGFLEPPAFEEGILERYPIFLDIVLNHISGDTVDFSHAITCLRLLFEMLGCKVWLRSTLSPSVMRNTLLGQCFHTRNEKTHKDIFDLFQPFLQSLEALQDGELEKQRRNFLYFLLYQVPVSSNFSVMIRQKACQIAFLIVHRGYTMDPPSPPFECAHMWGPPLVSSLKDSSLHNSLRQPAFDLIQAIIVSDAAALIGSILSCSPQLSRRMLHEFDDEDIGELLTTIDTEENDDSCWRYFCLQSKIASLEFGEWKCIPMLWIDVLVDINPSVLPLSFSKAVFWARSRFSLVERENSSKMSLPVRTWLLSSATDISSCFGWKAPTGSDDGGDKESKNSIEVSTMSLPLMQTFKRLTTHFIAEVGQSELRKQWTWEPRMGESLILSLLDPDDTIRQFGKCILEQVSTTRGLACGLKFLCSSTDSVAAIFFGLRHAVKLVLLDTVVWKFQTLHHFFFVIYKLLKEGDLSTTDELGKSSDSLNTTKLSSQGGFLRQPVFDCLPVNINEHSTDYSKLLEKFYYLLSKIIWLCVKRCLMEGKEFTDYSNCQMTCVRLLEIVPVVFQRLYPLNCEQTGSSSPILKSTFDFSWLHDLVDWGNSSLKVVFVYWKRTVFSLLKLLRSSFNDTDLSTVSYIENLISCDTVSIDKLMAQVSRLSVSLSKKSSCDIGKNSFISKAPYNESLPLEMKDQPPEVHLPGIEDTDIQILDSPRLAKTKNLEDLIILSDDEKVVLPCDVDSAGKTGQCMLGRNTVMLSQSVDESTTSTDSSPNNVCGINPSKALLKPFPRRDDSDVSHFLSQKLDKLRDKAAPTSISRSEALDGNWKELIDECTVVDSFNCKSKFHLKKSSDEAISSKRLDDSGDKLVSKAESLLKEIVCETEDDTLESALDSTRKQCSQVEKSSMLIPKAPKRQLIQLETPVDRAGHFQRLHAQAKRFKPPRLDEWYKPILETDYFVTVGLTSASEDGNCKGIKLKEVPIRFQSPEQYVQIFRPLVLEEFKAQLQSSFLEMSSWEEIYFGRLSVLSIERVDDFHIVRCSHDDDDPTARRSFSENDLILFTKEPPQKNSHNVHMVGKVERRERDNKRKISILLIRLYLQNGTTRLHQARRKLLERSKWHASRIMTMSPQLREFQALSSIKDIPLLPVILNPSHGSYGSNESKEVNLSKLSQPLQRILKSSFNHSQLQAISLATGSHNAKKSTELSLIQGPPGSGKTRTILAIASALLACPLWRTDNVNLPVHHSLKQNSSLPKICQTAAIARAWQDAALAKQLNENIQTSSKSMESSARRRVLICAQSNAAVDELVSRVSSHGLYGSDGKMYKPYLVRVGNAKTVHPNSLPFFIDTLVDQRLASERIQLSHGSSGLSVQASVSLHSNLETLMDRIRFYEAKRASLSDENSDFGNSLELNCQKVDEKMSDAEIGLKLRKLYEQKRQIYKDLSTVQAQEKKANDEIKGLKYKLRRSILKESEIVVTTLSGCGGDLFRVCSESMSNHKFGSPPEHTLFDAVVIDEAAQALEPATLIPLQLLKSSGTKCIMVGDPKQLPATVLSNTATKFLYECSMFERLQKAGHPVVMLTEQYRMHPEICQFPSLHFYDSKLLNGCNISSKTAAFHETEGLGPYIFYNVIDGREHRGENSGALSLYNEHEADAAVELLKFFKKRHPSEFVAGRIGILTPYKCQLSLLRSRFSSAFGSSVAGDMEFNTVDGFQGREVDILILSTVRASEPFSVAPVIKSSNIGFVADVRRMNVALTRARLSLWVMGNAQTLQTNENWAALVKNAKDRNLVKTVNVPYKSMFKTASQRIPGVENSDVHLVESKCSETVENAMRNGKQYKKGAKKSYFKHRAGRRGFVDEKDTPAIKEDSPVIKGNATDELDLQANVLSSLVAASSDRKPSKGGKSVIAEKHVADGRTKVKESSQSLGNYHLGKFEDSGKNLDHLKSPVSRRPKTSPRSNNRSRNSEVSSSIGCHIELGCDKGRDPPQVDTSEALIAKRKQQRDAVDAILYSALISSKKTDKLVKPVSAKRPSSSAASVSMRPSKKRKD